jgi:biopolymer transport protein ExbD
MRRKLLQIMIATFSLIAGIGFHRASVNAAEFVLAYDSIVLEEPWPVTSDSDSSDVTCAFLKTNAIVISMPDDRKVYLGKKLVGTADDTGELERQLAIKFGEQERRLNEAVPTARSREATLTCDYRSIYIKAFWNSSYGDVTRLIEASKRAGALHVGLIAERRKPVRFCCGGLTIR